MKLLLYCTKGRPYLFETLAFPKILGKYYLYPNNKHLEHKSLNGKIVAECDFEVEEIYERVSLNDSWFNDFHHTKTMKNDELLKKSCLKVEEMNKYFDYPKNTLNKVGYAIHIKNLHIFDKPKELNEFYKFVGIDKGINNYKSIEKAPQNMMYAYEYTSEIGFSGTWNRMLNGRIIISIRPEWLVKILNGEKTIEVRKKVLKGMI